MTRPGCVCWRNASGIGVARRSPLNAPRACSSIRWWRPASPSSRFIRIGHLEAFNLDSAFAHGAVLGPPPARTLAVLDDIQPSESLLQICIDHVLPPANLGSCAVRASPSRSWRSFPLRSSIVIADTSSGGKGGAAAAACNAFWFCRICGMALRSEAPAERLNLPSRAFRKREDMNCGTDFRMPPWRLHSRTSAKTSIATAALRACAVLPSLLGLDRELLAQPQPNFFVSFIADFWELRYRLWRRGSSCYRIHRYFYKLRICRPLIAQGRLFLGSFFHGWIFKVWSPVHNGLVADDPTRMGESSRPRTLTNNLHLVQPLKLLNRRSHGSLPFVSCAA